MFRVITLSVLWFMFFRVSIERLDSLSCTDVQQKWGRESVKTLYEPRPVHEFCHVECREGSTFPPNVQDDIRKELIEAAPNSALAKHKQRQRKTREAAPHDDNAERVMDTVFAAEHVNPILRDYTEFRFFEQVQEGMSLKVKRFSLSMLDAKQRTFYEEKVCLSHARAKQICLDTANQDSTLWQSERKKRITGSICRELHTFEEKNKRTWAAKLDRLYCRSTFTGNEATTYGKDNEPVALEEYETVHQAKVGRLGLVVAPEVPWLGYSADGVSSQGNRRVLIEVKCPVMGKEDSIANLVHEKKVQFLHAEGENIVLRKKHKYYSQVQLGMLLLAMDVCHFVVYSPVGSLVLEVPRDVEHMRELLGRLQYVYFKKILPKLAEISTR